MVVVMKVKKKKEKKERNQWRMFLCCSRRYLPNNFLAFYGY